MSWEDEHGADYLQEGDDTVLCKCAFCDEPIMVWDDALRHKKKLHWRIHKECLRDYVDELDEDQLAEQLGFKFYLGG